MSPPSAPTSSRPLLLLVGLDLVVAVWATTQYLAQRLGNQPNLGAWVYAAPRDTAAGWRAAAVLIAGAGVTIAVALRKSSASVRRWVPAILLGTCIAAVSAVAISLGPIYPPSRALAWSLALRNVAAAQPLLDSALGVFGSTFLVLLTVTLAARPRRQPRSPSTSHGSAVWGAGETLDADVGLELGRVGDRLLRYGGDGHVITIAPTRTGKGIGSVIPNLLQYPGSVVVTDPKGENYAVTARRRGEMGSAVRALDPFGVVGGTAAFNPLDVVDVSSPDANDDAWMLADMLIVTTGKEGEHGFWTEEARALLAGLILHVAANAPPELRTLTHVRELLTLAPEPFQILLDDMLASDAVAGLVSRAAARILQKADRERSGVISSAQSHTHFLDSPRMAAVLGRSSFDLADLKRDALSVYLVLPPERMDTYRAWLRIMIACCLLAMTRVAGRPKRRVLFLLDEFANLGRMGPVERAISLAGAYGTSFWLLLQDLAQLKGSYEKWQTFLANADVLQAFGVNDWETAEYLSKMTGESTVFVESENVSRGVSRGRDATRQESSTRSTSEKGRRLLLPDEVRRLGRESQLLFVRGSSPVLARKLNYLSDAEYRGLADPNPMHAVVGSGTRSLQAVGGVVS